MSSTLITAIAGSVIRTALVFLGGLLTAHGIMSADQYQSISPTLQEALGGLVSAGALGWAAWQKHHAETVTQAKEMVAVQTGTTTASRAGDTPSQAATVKAAVIVADAKAKVAGA